MKKGFNLYLSEDKIEELKRKAKAQDISVSDYIKTKIFPDRGDEDGREH